MSEDVTAVAAYTRVDHRVGNYVPEQVSKEIEDILEALRDVVDPELGINVVDLGLIYGVDLDEARVATIDMTLTSAACPLTDVIEEQAGEALKDSWPTSGSTGSGCRRGGRSRSPMTGASSCGPWGSIFKRRPTRGARPLAAPRSRDGA